VGGALIQWLRDQMGFFPDAADSEALAREVEDTGGVSVVPAFTGLGAPYWDPDARGAILGLSRGTTRAHIARASLEAIAFQNSELVECLREETGLAVDRLLADGGATANDLLMQLQSDLAGLEVHRGANVEATARGAAGLAGLGAEIFPDIGIAAGLHEDAIVFRPAIDERERASRLEGWRSAVDRVRST